MATKNRFVTNITQSSWIRWCRSLLDLYETRKTYVAKDLYHASHLDMQRWIVGHKMDGVDLLLRNLLLDAMLSADRKVPGSGVYVPYCLFEQPELNSIRSSSQEYLKCIRRFKVSEKALDLFEQVVSVCGPLTKIVVKKSPNHDTIIKYRNKFNFPLRVDSQFQRMLGNCGTLEQNNPIVIMIEGAPETIGEIHPLLEKNHDDGRPVLLIARSFPEEVSATLASNWLKGSLSILPVTYGDSIETINLAADLCAVTQGELISPHFGDLIVTSILQEDKQGTVDHLYWDSTGVSFEKNVDTSGHVKHLLSKIKQSDNSELVELYQQRILSLSNDAIEVWVPNEETKLIDELDSLIKHYNAFVHSGAVKTPLGYLPNSFIINAQTTAASLQEKILNIGGFLVRVTTDDNLVA